MRLAIIAAIKPDLTPNFAQNLSIGGLVLSLLFLFVYWALQLRVNVSVRGD